MALNMELLETSFREAAKEGDKFGELFFNRLFQMYPEVAPLFENTDINGQKEKLVWGLKFIVDNLGNRGALSGILRKLGGKYQSYNIRKEHYPMMGAALLTTLAEILKKRWTPEMKDVWSQAYEEIVELILRGYEEPKPVPLRIPAIAI